MTTLIPKFDFKNGGATPAGAINRPINQKLSETVNVLDFGAVGDGSTDDTSAIQAAINYIASVGSGTILFPAGVFKVTSGFTITTPMVFSGQGSGSPGNGTTIPATLGTEIKYTGASGATLITFSEINYGGIGIENIWLNSNNLANYGCIVSGVSGGIFNGFSSTDANICALKVLGTTINTCSWNTFNNTYLRQVAGAKGALWLSGQSGSPSPFGNACHNTFTGTRIDFGGTANGIYMGLSDNNAFLMTFIYDAPAATGYGVLVDPSEQATFPVNNTFYHLQCSTRGWYQPSTTTQQPAIIYGYMEDNGQPRPITNGTYLPLYNSRGGVQIAPGSSSIGYSTGTNFTSGATFPNGATTYTVNFPYGNEPDINYGVLIETVGGFLPTYTINAKTVSSFRIDTLSPTGSTVYFNWFIFRL